MTTRDEVLAAAEAQEETVAIGGKAVLVRELDCAADLVGLQEDKDQKLKLLIRCAFDPDSGEPLFTEADIPALKRRSSAKMQPLLKAVLRVNGLWAEAEEKKSPAGPSAG